MAITVNAGRVPGEIKTYGVEDDATIADVLSAAGITLGAGESLTLDGESGADVEDCVEQGSTLLITRQVKGN